MSLVCVGRCVWGVVVCVVCVRAWYVCLCLRLCGLCVLFDVREVCGVCVCVWGGVCVCVVCVVFLCGVLMCMCLWCVCGVCGFV